MHAFSKIVLIAVLLVAVGCATTTSGRHEVANHPFNGSYSGDNLRYVAFPLGGLGAGTICIEGVGSFTHVSLNNNPNIGNIAPMFGALCVKGEHNVARVLEGPVPDYKIFSYPRSANGAPKMNWGLPRFDDAEFLARFPFAEITLNDEDIPLEAKLTAWSPFVPSDADSSSLPVAALEYTFTNPTNETKESIFSFNSAQFMSSNPFEGRVKAIENGFVLTQTEKQAELEPRGELAIAVDEPAKVDHAWFSGPWWDPLTVAWKDIEEGTTDESPVEDKANLGASVFVPFTLSPGQSKTVRVLLAWYAPGRGMRMPLEKDFDIELACKPGEECEDSADCSPSIQYPWYTGRFADVREVMSYWRSHYARLRKNSAAFRDCFYDSTLPPEVLEAVSANLGILKSPTMVRQPDGRLWAFEGCSDTVGCCAGSCTHVWNYAQAVAHLFPELERSLRNTEFMVDQFDSGFQIFRAPIPVRRLKEPMGAAASDGQLGGIMKLHREWRISGDNEMLRNYWPKARQSLLYCIETWDPERRGYLTEPHHNTYDIEFWGPDGMCTSFYLGALKAAILMGTALGEDVSEFETILADGREFLETELFNGEYFYQRVEWRDSPHADALIRNNPMYRAPEAQALLEKEGPKYQYGTGCISDGVLGFWLARVCGVGDVVDPEKVRSHLRSVHKYNLKDDLSDHANPQRPSYAMGEDGGLLLCTWPKGDKPTLPFVYSDEVWTGIEYQVASHLMFEGMVHEGLDIVRACRERYDGRVRNPFDEYECGHWYGRALSSYGLLEGLTGARYDAVEKTLYIDSQVGDFRSFLSTNTGFGTVGLKGGQPFFKSVYGAVDIQRCVVAGVEMEVLAE